MLKGDIRILGEWVYDVSENHFDGAIEEAFAVHDVEWLCGKQA